jgi:alpha-galactosidase
VIDFLRKQGNRKKTGFPAKLASLKNEKHFIFSQLKLGYRVHDRQIDLELPGPLPDDITLQSDTLTPDKQCLVFSIDLLPNPLQANIRLQSFSVSINPGFSIHTRMMVNGFQSWSRSEELGSDDRLSPLAFPARTLLAPYGDHLLFNYSGKKGRLHSWNYTYFRLENGQIVFFGSIDEKSGYTSFEYDFNTGKLIIRKDCDGTDVSGSFRLLSLFIGTGRLDLLLAGYQRIIGRHRPIAPKASGWCSWYNYYTAVSEQVVINNLESLEKRDLPLDIFQIDDGWQHSIGDWLHCNDKFPSGMKAVADQIKIRGFQPGIWLAPLICVPSSQIYKEHPQWLLCDQKGRPVRAGFNPGWEGFFYALDFYAPGVQDYLEQVFRQVQENWGYRMLKLDFLYAAALLPRKGKPRGEIMSEVIDFIEAKTRNSILLGCGVPIASVFGKFDYCRIGSDVGPYWEDYLKVLHYRERVSTENSLVSTIGRHHFDSLFFRNDPDVFILRDGVRGVNYNKLNCHQRYSLFLLNNLLGGLIFFSDDISELTGDQYNLLRSAYPLVNVKLTDLQEMKGLYHFSFTIRERNYRLYANLSNKKQRVITSGSYHFHPDRFLIPPGSRINLEPFESICLYRIESSEKDIFLLGATGHIFPGAQIDSLITDPDQETVEIVLNRDALPGSAVYLGLPFAAGSLRVNGLNRMLMEKDGIRYVRVDFCREGGL